LNHFNLVPLNESMQRKLKGRSIQVLVLLLTYFSSFSQNFFDRMNVSDYPEVLCPNTLSEGALQWNNWFTKNESEIFYTMEESGKTFLVRRSFNECLLGPVEKLDFDEKYNYSYPWVNEDGTRIIFQASIGSVKTNKIESHIMESWYTKSGWTKPKVFNLASSDVKYKTSPMLSGIGNLYFSSGLPGNTLDIHKVMKNRGAEHSDLVSLDYSINDFFIDKNEEFIIFSSSSGGNGNGLSDLYISFQTDEGWTQAKSLGSKINSAQQDFSPYITSDKQYLIFTRSYSSFRMLKPFFKQYIVKLDLDSYR